MLPAAGPAGSTQLTTTPRSAPLAAMSAGVSGCTLTPIQPRFPWRCSSTRSTACASAAGPTIAVPFSCGITSPANAPVVANANEPGVRSVWLGTIQTGAPHVLLALASSVLTNTGRRETAPGTVVVQRRYRGASGRAGVQSASPAIRRDGTLITLRPVAGSTLTMLRSSTGGRVCGCSDAWSSATARSSRTRYAATISGRPFDDAGDTRTG